MLASEYPEFESQLKILENIFGKVLDDSAVKAYWFALKDQPLEKFKSFVQKHIRRGKFFPKPGELRAKDDVPLERDAKMDADFKSGELRTARNLEAIRRDNPKSWEAEVRLRKLDRVIATTHEEHPAYSQILREWREARGIHVGADE